ncbi:hypothetical protein GCM10023144_05670 [Pigmentiphaga soli]|uniref:Lipoprotein n=1 Tax=Pigmentiphaga soli TaxID=1007095 RepID=A0ABP8GHE6_9BURK
MNVRFAAAALSAALFCAAAQAQAPVKTQDGLLVDSAGMTLYTFDRDSGGKSACNGACVKLWPPVMATAADKPSGDYTVIARDDGGKQWAYKGKPLYRYASDAKPGDRGGDNFKEVWHVVKP